MPDRTSATTTQPSTQPALQPAVQAFVAACAKALRACPKGQCAIYAGGQALLQDDGSIACLGNIAAATGATLICENAFPRIDRGRGLPHFQVWSDFTCIDPTGSQTSVITVRAHKTICVADSLSGVQPQGVVMQCTELPVLQCKLNASQLCPDKSSEVTQSSTVPQKVLCISAKLLYSNVTV